MCTHRKIIFNPLPATPTSFDEDKFKEGDERQMKKYKAAKQANQSIILNYEQVIEKRYNYARQVPMGGCFIDYDNKEEFETMKQIIIRARLKCLILKTQRGGQFLFRLPSFYKKEMTEATNWFGYKFDTKASWVNKKKEEIHAVQNMRVCGMKRVEIASWDLDTPIPPDTINIDELDILPYWLWGKGKDEKLFKDGKMGKIKAPDTGEELPAHIYKIDNSPFTELMKMTDGERHNHIFSYCRTFALYNGFLLDDFKAIIHAIHDEFLVKIGTYMSDSDLLGDVDKGWEKYITELISDYHGSFDESTRIWSFAKETTDKKIDERRAAEYLFDITNYFVSDKNTDGTYNNLLHSNKDGSYNYKNDFPELKQNLRDYSDQNFKEPFYKEVSEQLMQMCIEHNKTITRNDYYVFAKNKILFCKSPETRDFDWIGTKPPTDVVLPWNWYPREWVEEHKEDLGCLITNFIEQLSRDTSGKSQPIIQDWLWVVAGASMIPFNKLQKIIIMAGGGNNGKSLYTSLIRLCLGEYMFNESKIFSSNPNNNKFWGEDLDKGILCVVDDMPRLYDREAFTAVKGAVTGSDSGLYINEKFKPKKKLEVLPQIIACTNFEFELYDKTEGMRRRLCIIPTEFEIPPEKRDFDLQHKLVLNTMDKTKIDTYQMSDEAFNYSGKKVMNMYTDEKGVQDSLQNGSLAWFANKARYMYMDWVAGKLNLEYTEKMKRLLLLEHTFEDTPKGQCEDFANWHLINKCGGTDGKVIDLSPANGFYYELYLIFKNEYCVIKKITAMDYEQFKSNFGRVVNSKYTVKKKKNDKGIPYPYIFFDKPKK